MNQLNSEQLEADYLVVGTGAMGMAFTDVLVTETDATVIMVDRNHKPGGHWTTAYPFVRLHQPSAFYGVNSRPLGENKIDQVGFNKGLYELASAQEVVSYFEQVMREQFLPSGRVRYFPMCDYEGDGLVVSRLSGEETRVKATKIVDSTYMNVTVPSMRPPPFPVADEVSCVPLNDLVKVDGPKEGYVVIGAGKTGMDACLFLLANGASPDDIRWIMPRDSWILNRANLQPELITEELASPRTGERNQWDAKDMDDLFDILEESGQLLRIDPSVKPTMYRCATVTMAEIEALRSIRNVVRMGHVVEITDNEIRLEEGSIPTTSSVLHVDCTADALATRPSVPVFSANQLTLQAVRTCQQVFSAAFIAYVEATIDDDEDKNRICAPVPHPESDVDWLRTTLGTMQNGGTWASVPKLQQWLMASRLDPFSRPPKEGESTPQFAENVGDMLKGAMRVSDLYTDWLSEQERT
tara:strand:+ start:1185 stop:2588 length:1404 start_codon:yes stop_codon:yes gene_type:complete